MGYTIEISFDLIKANDIESMKRSIVDSALDMGCDHYYYLYEMGPMSRHHCVIAVHYVDSMLFECSNFIRTIRKRRQEGLSIECLYEDDVTCKLIYASSSYLKEMDKSSVIKYNRFKRERSLSDQEKTLLDGFATKQEKEK